MVQDETQQIAEYWDRIAPQFDAIYTGKKNPIAGGWIVGSGVTFISALTGSCGKRETSETRPCAMWDAAPGDLLPHWRSAALGSPVWILHPRCLIWAANW